MPKPAIYLFAGIGSGQLGNNQFTNSSFVILAPGDAAGITTDPNTFGAPAQALSIPPAAAELVLNGQILAFSTGLTIAALSNAGLYRVSIGMGLQLLAAVTSPQLQGYGLAQSIGPVSGTGTFTPQVWQVSGGQVFALNSISSATFQAIVFPASVPSNPPPSNPSSRHIPTPPEPHSPRH